MKEVAFNINSYDIYICFISLTKRKLELVMCQIKNYLQDILHDILTTADSVICIGILSLTMRTLIISLINFDFKKFIGTVSKTPTWMECSLQIYCVTENISRHRIVDNLIWSRFTCIPRTWIELLTRFLGSFFVAICASWIFNGAPIIRIQQCTEKAVTYVLEKEKGKRTKAWNWWRDISVAFFVLYNTHCYAKSLRYL